ncbi:MAG: class I SAM-dependent methyltransferase [Melioribacteraceae bacterium]|nr:class I SAM-dependent methyltransferase [Melioribacteraceae bacterium]
MIESKNIRECYDSIAGSYHKRYDTSRLFLAENKLVELIRENNICCALEIGCGTGYWLNLISNLVNVVGADYSLNMLLDGKKRYDIKNLLQADATNFPIKNNSLEFIYCINAIHHFSDKKKFIMEATASLNKNGILLIIGFDPHDESCKWYMYDFFDGVRKFDLNRTPSFSELVKICSQIPGSTLEMDNVDLVAKTYVGSDVFNDPFLEKSQASQLSILSADEYKKGIEKIKRIISEYPSYNFTVNLPFKALTIKMP